MFLPINGRIAIIDNVIEEVEPLFKIFSKNRIPYIFIQGDDMDYLPEEDDESNDLRIVFLDLNLLGERTPTDKEVKSSLYPILKRIISKNNFPYSVIIWSKQEDRYLNVVKELFELELSDRQPITIEPFIKSDFFQLDGKAKETSNKDIIKELKNILLKHQSYSTLIYWENKVHKSADTLLQDIFKSFEINNWIDNSNFVISKLGENYLGRTTYKNSNYVEQIRGSLQAFNSIFIDALEYSIFSKSNLLEQPKLKYDDAKINKSNLIGIVNEKLLLSKSDLVIHCTGTVTEDQNPKSEKIFKSVLNDSFDRFQVESGIEFSKEEQEDEGKRKKKVDKEASKKRKDIRGNWQKVYLVVTPLCDYVQNKNRNIRLIKGFIISNSEKKYIDSKSEAIIITPPYFDSDYNEMRTIVFNYRYFFTFGDPFRVKDLKPLFRLRNQLVAEIQSKLARHINRQGILFLDDRE